MGDKRMSEVLNKITEYRDVFSLDKEVIFNICPRIVKRLSMSQRTDRHRNTSVKTIY